MSVNFGLLIVALLQFSLQAMKGSVWDTVGEHEVDKTGKHKQTNAPATVVTTAPALKINKTKAPQTTYSQPQTWKMCHIHISASL